MTFARFATVAVPLPPREPGPPPPAGRTAANAAPPAVRPGAVTGRDTALMPVYPAGRRAGDRPTAVLPACEGEDPRRPAPLSPKGRYAAEAGR